MTQPITITTTADAAIVERLLDRLIPRAAPVPSRTAPLPSWVTETPWFERHGKLTAKEAADLEASTYGTGVKQEATATGINVRYSELVEYGVPYQDDLHAESRAARIFRHIQATTRPSRHRA